MIRLILKIYHFISTLCQHGLEFIKLQHHFNSPLEHAEDRGSSKETNVATKVGNECHEGVSVELLIDLQLILKSLSPLLCLAIEYRYLHTGGQLNVDRCRFGGQIVGVSLASHTLLGQCRHHHTAGLQQLNKQLY